MTIGWYRGNTVRGNLRTLVWIIHRPLIALSLIVTFVACSIMPSLEEQKRSVQQNDIRVHYLTPRAFVEVWGKPTYTHQQFSQFFVMKDGSLIPQSRLSLGESPQGWETGLEAGDALFVGYADQGWFLVFFEDRLVYRESMPAAKIHALGKTWKYEEQFKTRLERPLDSSR